MAKSLDRSLDEIIKFTRLGRQLNIQLRRNLTRPYSRNPPRRFPLRNSAYVSSPSAIALTSILTISNKLDISNLDYGVTESDLLVLFEEIGPVKSVNLHCDRLGLSLGTANVTYEFRQDAFKALRTFNGVPLDGRPMRIEFSLPNRLRTHRVYTPPAHIFTAEYAPAYSQRQQSGNYGHIFRNSRFINKRLDFGYNRRDRAQKRQPTLEELDAELDAYINNKSPK